MSTQTAPAPSTETGSVSVPSTLRAGVVGASGFTGAELLRLLANHPTIAVEQITGDTQAGNPVRDLYPSLAATFDGVTYGAYDAELFAGLDVVFLCLPHMASQPIVQQLWGEVGCIVDLGSDFRLRDAQLYPTWYGEPHTCPELITQFAYGLPELDREPIVDAAAVAVPGCYPTAAALALAPFARAGVIEQSNVVVDAASGVSGAGRTLKESTTFTSVDDNFSAYGLLNHRHTPEIEQATGLDVLFTPHLAPMARGILATCYARVAAPGSFTTDDALNLLFDAYADEPFMVVSEQPPQTKATLGANTAHLTARVDGRTGWLVAMCAIDNLVKGASGGAVQCANLALGLEEAAGLPLVGLGP